MISTTPSQNNDNNNEINQKKSLLKKQLLEYSTNVKNYAKWFEISEVKKDESSFTSYKVIYRVFDFLVSKFFSKQDRCFVLLLTLFFVVVDFLIKYNYLIKFLPKDLNESIKELIVWKRFKDFRELNQYMYDYHIKLHRKDKFPEFPSAKYFGRFDDKIIEERKECSLRLLQFIGSQSHLYRHEKFYDFFSVLNLFFFN
jgi:hypothetical protein